MGVKNSFCRDCTGQLSDYLEEEFVVVVVLHMSSVHFTDADKANK